MKYFIITYGCQMNKSDSERIASVLEKIGYQPAQKDIEADLILVNMCSVRQSAVDRVYGKIKQIQKLKANNPNLKAILTGCILKEDRKKFAKGFDLILNTKDLPRTFFNKKIMKELNLIPSEKVRGLPKWPKLLKIRSYEPRIKNYLRITPKYQDNFSAFVPISNGCNNFCTYCVVPFTRGLLTCRDHRDILKEVKNLTKKRFKEIWLLGQNVNRYRSKSKIKNRVSIYGSEGEEEGEESKLSSSPFAVAREDEVLFAHQKSKIINFANLLKMVNAIPSDFKFFFTSPHPKDFSDELINTLAKCEKFGKYLNLPVQSGDNKILKRMNRNYTVKEYESLIKKIRAKIPEIKLSTDVIVGFPGETKKQFQNTVKLFKKIKFDNAYIAKYSPRPGTAAWQMKDNVPLTEKKQREKILRELITQHG